MKRVIVIGCPGSGKSTFSRVLAEKTGLPLYHLDMLYWNADRTTVEKTVFLTRLSEVMKSEQWIIDGNYGSTMELRIAAADTVYFLDLPTEVCLEGICERRGKPRVDMPWVERKDEQDEEFIRFIENYNTISRPKVLSILERYPDRKIVTFSSREEMTVYLENLEKCRFK